MSTPPDSHDSPDGPGPGATADAVVAAVLAVPGVAELHPGRFGEVGTYLPGRRVRGVRVSAERVDVHVVLQAWASVLPVAQRVHAAVAALVDVPVRVHVEDVVLDASPGHASSGHASSGQASPGHASAGHGSPGAPADPPPADVP